MVLPQALLANRIHDVNLKAGAEAAYDIQTAQGLTETGGLALIGSSDQTITAGGTEQAIANWSNAYQAKVVVGNSTAGTLVTTAALSFDIDLEILLVRSAGTEVSKVTVEIFSDNDAVLGSQTLLMSPQKVQKFAISLAAEAVSAASTLSVRIGGETVTGEVITVSNGYFYIQSTT